MKTPEQFLVDLRRRVTKHWHLDLDGPSGIWPHTFALGTVLRSDLETDFAIVQTQTFRWREWTAQHQIELTTAVRHVRGTRQAIPSHVTIHNIDTAARLLGQGWVERIKTGRDRYRTLSAAFPETPNLPNVVRDTDSYPPVDFDLLCSTARWFRTNSASGLTPRQVPIEGSHAKWLNTHQAVVLALAGVDTLDLLPPHPQRIHFTYLDPEHLSGGGRKHDSATAGDTMTPAYEPAVVVISENKDTAIHFPPLPAGIAVEGGGFAGPDAIRAFPWIVSCPRILYWGDMDAAGLEIVNAFRHSGVPVQTILMDLTAYEAYERYGASTDTKGNPLTPSPAKSLPHLTPAERSLYDALTDPEWRRPLRVEQERIPLTTALGQAL